MGKWSCVIGMALGSFAFGCSSGPPQVCGDSLVSGTESCDDGNATPDDGCDDRCRTESGYTCATAGEECTPRCGDGELVSAEVCDPSTSQGRGYCAADCSAITGRCGDGIVQAPPEACDDDNTEPRDGCDSCHATFSYVCDAATNHCAQTTIAPDTVLYDLTDAERMALCQWQVDFLGGPGMQYACSTNNFVVRSVSACESQVAEFHWDVAHCTVGDFQSWAAMRSTACDFFQNGSDPCPSAAQPDCDRLDVSCTTHAPTCPTGQVPSVDLALHCWTGTCVPERACACTSNYACPSNMCDYNAGRCLPG